MKKTKILVITLLAGFALHQMASAQTGDTTNAAPTDASGAASTSPATAEGANQSISITASNAIAGAGETNAPEIMAVSNAPVSIAPGENADAGAGSPSSPAPAVASGQTAVVAATNMANAELPIQFQDVPITTAIETLARMAGINYLLDPKIGYNQPDQSGQIKPEPTLSLRWENVTAKEALLALLDNYGMQLVQTPKSTISKVTMKEPNALPVLITRVIQLKYASTSNMEASVVSTLTDRRSRVVPDARTSQLVVVATDPEQTAVDTLLSQLDKPTRQVLIETKLVELSSKPETSKGIDWSGTLQAQNVTFGNGYLSGSSTKTTPGTTTVVTPAVTSPSGAVITPAVTTTPESSTVSTLISSIGYGGFAASTADGLLPASGFLTADGVKAVISFLNQSAEAQVVSTPRVVTLDNETAIIAVYTGYPIVNVTAGTANSTGGSGITYSNIGTMLRVTPRITANDYIWLKVIPDVSSFAGQQNISAGGVTFTPDIFETRHIETQVLIPNSHTLVMGGLVQDNPNASYTKVPVLGDIPLLGVAFRSEKKSMQKNNLLIFITPTIVQDSDFRPMTSDFLQSTPRTMQDPMKMHAWLDSAQPRGDWSNPLSDQDVKAQKPAAGNAAFAP